MKVLAVKNWDRDFEISQSRRSTAAHSWVAIPNKHDGKGYGRVAAHPDGVAIFTAWILIVQIASKCPVRGVLADEDGPLTVEDIAIKTRFPVAIFQRAVEVLTQPNIGWLVALEDGEIVPYFEHSVSAIRAQSQLHDSTEHDKTRHENTPLPPKGAAPAARGVDKSSKPTKYNAANEPTSEWLKPLWAKWCSHRAEIKHPIKPTQAAALIAKLEGWGQKRTETALDYSISNGYRGLIEPTPDRASAVISVANSNKAEEVWAVVLKRIRGQKLDDAERQVLVDERTQYAIGLAGGGQYLSNITTEQLPYARRDFTRAYAAHTQEQTR